MSRIIGHKQERFFCEQVLVGQMHGHAFLFEGPESVGKYTMALCFANALARGERDISWHVADHIAQDVIVCAPQNVQEKKKTRIKKISVEEVRHLRKRLMLAKDESAKVLVIDGAHEMTHAAQNALLKLIEEPPRDTYIIFVTSDKSRLLPTVQSRMTTLTFGLLSQNDLTTLSEDDEIVRLAQGRPGNIVTLLNDNALLTEYREYIAVLKNLKNMSLHERITYAADVVHDDRQAQTILSLWQWHIRTVMLETQKPQIIRIIERIAHTLRAYQTSQVNRKLLMEDLLIHL